MKKLQTFLKKISSFHVVFRMNSVAGSSGYILVNINVINHLVTSGI